MLFLVSINILLMTPTKHIIKIIAGLQNPGPEYAKTRHNAGAWFVESLVEKAGLVLKNETKFHALHATMTLHGERIHLLLPTTFMNLSGQSIRAFLQYHKLPPESLLVAHDDIDLEPGIARLKFDGGDGGHNGLKNIIRHLGTKQFFRLRLGVGRPKHDTIDYVLGTPTKSEQSHIAEAIRQAEEVMPLVLDGRIDAAMKHLHTKQ